MTVLLLTTVHFCQTRILKSSRDSNDIHTMLRTKWLTSKVEGSNHCAISGAVLANTHAAAVSTL